MRLDEMSKSKKEFLFNLTFGAVVFVLYLANKSAKVFYFLPLEFGRNHMNDTLAGLLWPCYLNSILFLVKSKYRLTKLLHLLLMAVACSFIWEFIYPTFINKCSTSDFYDCICYFFGSIGYLVIYRISSVIFDFG